jgi:hypothetical protein
MYAAGTGVAQDYLRAYMWLNIAVAHGNSLMIIHLNSISEHLTPAQIVEAKQLVRGWMENHHQRKSLPRCMKSSTSDEHG